MTLADTAVALIQEWQKKNTRLLCTMDSSWPVDPNAVTISYADGEARLAGQFTSIVINEETVVSADDSGIRVKLPGSTTTISLMAPP